ncbi:ABC transporter permease subunit [Clostridium sp. KNHs214]|uniref:ABC transporter permease subunit n=1 Tax=Clostridium sp. KNHs214 TaxID=1540257 RepID=UPI0005578D22|nr:ABC transporter permease subunit [Clostridium sp. KNHs214]
MYSLIKFEFKKLAKKRVNIITSLVSLILTIIFSTLFITKFEYLDASGDYKGLKAIELKKEDVKKLPNEITEEQVAKDIKAYQKLFSNPKNTIKNEVGEVSLKNDIYLKYVSPKREYLSMIAYNYCEPGNEVFDLSKILTIKSKEGTRFYKIRNNKVSTFLNMNHKGGNYSEEEKTFWLNKISKIQGPYKYGYYEGWESVNRSLGALIFTLLAIIIMVAPIFAGEYQSGADAIILAAKYGKTKIIGAKIIAAFAFATIVFALNLIFALAIPLLAFGIDGWNLPIQIKDTLIPIPYSVTFSLSTFICIGISYVVILGSVAFTLILSAKLKTPFTVLMVQVIILFASLFIKKGADNGLFNHILYLLPNKAMECDFSTYLSYSFGGLTISLLLMRVIVYGSMAIICLMFTKNIFRKHQVQ